ncbi:MAG: hypothetical protein ACTSR8_18860 [Promethearchaeota archaeon]
MGENYNKWTVKKLREFCSKKNISVPSGSRKADIVKLIEEFTSRSSNGEDKGTQGEEVSQQQKDDQIDEEATPKVEKTEYNFASWTVSQLREFCRKNNIRIPSGAKKQDIIDLIIPIVSHPEFIDRSQEEEEYEEEIIAGFDDEEDPALLYKEQFEVKFWQQPEYRVLLDAELAKDSQAAFYDLSTLVDKFFNNMLKEDLINYKISGIALKTAASLHHYKISSIIKEEEQIQKEEELRKFRERHSRTIPKALPQPIQPKMQIATKKELFGAMRAAIIETMQKKEKLKRNRMRREEEKQKRKKMRSKARLPKEILKHISGKEQTVEELHESWLNRIKASAKLNNTNEVTFFELMELIKNDEESTIGRRFALVRMFLALMFLSTGGASGTGKTTTEIELFQNEDFKDILINIK